MKITLRMPRLKPRRRPEPTMIETGYDWTVRDWADLPTHHPRSN
jgi:hypothetical protein